MRNLSELRRSRPLPVIVFLLVFTPAIASDRSAPTRVPFGSTIAVDGKLDEKEWKGSTSLVGNGRKVRLRHDGEKLYVQFETKGPGIATLFVELDGAVHVLHASARLGRATYVKKGDSYALKQGFDYRTPSDEFWESQHWRSNVSTSGGPGFEFEIDVDGFFGEVESAKTKGRRESPTSRRLPKIAFVPWTPQTGAAPIPVAGDDTANVKLLLGETPASLTFDPSKWLDLVLQPRSSPEDEKE